MAGEAWYEGAHSMTFYEGNDTAMARTGMNTWLDWHLIPTSRPDVASPPVNTSYVDIPGRHGQLDLSTYLTGGLTYGMRSGSWEFIIDNGWEHWEAIRERMMAYLHGQQRIVVMADSPQRYWIGRFSVEGFKSGASNTAVTIAYVLEPYQRAKQWTENDWLWDPFCFDTDYTDGSNRGLIL